MRLPLRGRPVSDHSAGRIKVDIGPSAASTLDAKDHGIPPDIVELEFVADRVDERFLATSNITDAMGVHESKVVSFKGERAYPPSSLRQADEEPDHGRSRVDQERNTEEPSSIRIRPSRLWLTQDGDQDHTEGQASRCSEYRTDYAEDRWRVVPPR
ncbi:hypothetical protein ACIQW5_28540 [Methylorubrum thiocyanatum]|uniref:hypothetical protein n=1 Tax=Methylorubrum thiocyanatum TaxID=47958 RepID=UPI003839D340